MDAAKPHPIVYIAYGNALIKRMFETIVNAILEEKVASAERNRRK